MKGVFTAIIIFLVTVPGMANRETVSKVYITIEFSLEDSIDNLPKGVYLTAHCNAGIFAFGREEKYIMALAEAIFPYFLTKGKSVSDDDVPLELRHVEVQVIKSPIVLVGKSIDFFISIKCDDPTLPELSKYWTSLAGYYPFPTRKIVVQLK